MRTTLACSLFAALAATTALEPSGERPKTTQPASAPAATEQPSVGLACELTGRPDGTLVARVRVTAARPSVVAVIPASNAPAALPAAPRAHTIHRGRITLFSVPAGTTEHTIPLATSPGVARVHIACAESLLAHVYTNSADPAARPTRSVTLSPDTTPNEPTPLWRRNNLAAVINVEPTGFAELIVNHRETWAQQSLRHP